MVAFIEKGFNRKKKKPVNGAEDTRVENVEKRENATNIESFELVNKTIELNNSVHRAENRLRSWTRRLVAPAALAVGLSGAPTVDAAQRIPEQFNNEDKTSEVTDTVPSGEPDLMHNEIPDLTHDEHVEENRGEVAAVFEGKLRTENGMEIARSCGATRYYNFAGDGGPVIMHIGQQHPGSGYHVENPGVHISQHTVGQCVGNVLENNNSGMRIPLVLEHLQPEIEIEGWETMDKEELKERLREERSKIYLFSALVRRHTYLDTGKFWFMGNARYKLWIEEQEKQNPRIIEKLRKKIDFRFMRKEATKLLKQLPYDIPREELYDLPDPILTLLMRFDESGEAKRIIDSMDRMFRRGLPLDFRKSLSINDINPEELKKKEREFFELANSLFTILKRLEYERNFYIIIGDDQFPREVEVEENGRKVKKDGHKVYENNFKVFEILNNGGKIEDEKKAVWHEEMRELVMDRRDKIAFRAAVIPMLEEESIGFSIMIYGTAHSIRDYGYKYGISVLRAETAPESAAFGVFNPRTASRDNVMFSSAIREDKDRLRYHIKKLFDFSFGSREKLVSELITNNDWHDAFLGNVGVFQDVLRDSGQDVLSQDEIFFIIKMGFQLNPHEYEHDIYISDPDVFKEHLSAEQFTELKRMLEESECEEYPQGKK